MNEHVTNTVLAVCTFLLIVLFAGEPDIQDAIVAGIRQRCAP